MPKVPFGDYMPDRPEFNNAGSIVIQNALPAAAGYKPFPGPVRFSTNSIGTDVKGAFPAVDRQGEVHIYAGTTDHLYKLQSNALQTATGSPSSTSSFSVPGVDRWEFVQYGQLVVATNINDPVQFTSAGGSNFSKLITSSTKPQAKHTNVVRDFLVLGYIREGGLDYPNRVRWSAFDNAADFDQSQTTLSDFQDLYGDGGVIQRVMGGEEGLIIQERSIWKMTFIGPPLIFQFDEIQPARGTIAPYSVARYGDRIFYLDEDGFYMLDARGGGIKPIGHSRVDRTFFDEFDVSNFSKISAAVDPSEGIVIWAYPGPGNEDGRPNRLLIYNWKIDKWASGVLETQWVFRALSPGYTLDQLDNFSTSLDLLEFSLDSRAWSGGSSEFAGFDEQGFLVFYQGTPLDAILTTKELQFKEGYRQVVTSVRPYVETNNSATATIRVSIGTRDKHITSTSFGPKITLNTIGEAPTRSNARYMRFRVDISGTWQDAQGVAVTQATKSGRR